MTGWGFFVALFIAASIGGVITGVTIYIVSLVQDIRRSK